MSAHGLHTEVGQRDRREVLRNTADIPLPPRAELPEALPVGERRRERQVDDPLGDALTIQEVADLLGCSVWTVRNRCLRRGLPYFRVGGAGKLVFYRAQVTRWILEQQEIHRGRR